LGLKATPYIKRTQPSILAKETSMQTLKVLLVDDKVNFNHIVKNIIAREQDMEIIGEASGGEEAIEKSINLKPDIILMDVRMPGMNGLKATNIIKQKMPEVIIIILTLYDIDEYREAAKSSGASGFVVKKDVQTMLISTIRENFASQYV
jgi:DNA-binding NarL/FixJ family response regulator